MQILLTQIEYDALTPVKRLQARNDALEVARKLIMSDEACKKTVCTECVIGQIEDRATRNHMCVKDKERPK